MTIQSNSGRPVRTTKIQIADFDQTATAQPIVAEGEGTDASGWIDCAGMKEIATTGGAAGADATITCQVRAYPGGQAATLTLGAEASLTAGTPALILDAEARYSQIRFLQAGTSSPGTNTVTLEVTLKG